MGFRFWTGRGWGWEGRFCDLHHGRSEFETLMRSIWEGRRKARQGKANDAMRCDPHNPPSHLLQHFLAVRDKHGMEVLGAGSCGSAL